MAPGESREPRPFCNPSPSIDAHLGPCLTWCWWRRPLGGIVGDGASSSFTKVTPSGSVPLKMALMTPSSRVRWLGLLALTSALPVLFSSSPSQGAVVKGKAAGIEKLLNPVWEKARDAAENRYTWREPSPTVRAEFRQLYAHAPKEICVVAMAEAAVPPSTATLALKFAGGRTSPVTLVVAPGTTIEFQNRDPFPHKPYIEGNPTFQPADMRSASVRQWKVPGPGKYEVKDHLFPSVRSWIVVEEKAAAVAYPQRDGAFTFANLAAGKYTLQAFWNGQPQGKPLQIDVAAANLDLKDALVLADLPAKEPGAKPGAKDPAGKKE